MGMGTVDIFELVGAIDVNEIMPPSNPGSSSVDFDAIRACWEDGEDASSECSWVNPPGAYCDDE
jgi:hypothetical protein